MILNLPQKTFIPQAIFVKQYLKQWMQNLFKTRACLGLHKRRYLQS